jgi:hypothetical protein
MSYKWGTTVQSVHYRAHKVCIKYADSRLHTPEKISYIPMFKCIIPVTTLHVVETTILEDLSDLKFELSEMF